MDESAAGEFEAVIIGAGFSGLGMLHHLNELGLRSVVLEAAGGVGGAWFWNTYPGARTDSEFFYYSFSFSEQVREEWTWKERYPSQPEVLEYLRFVSRRLGLDEDIRLGTRVERAEFDERDDTWTVRTDGGQRFRARYLISGAGVLSSPVLPGIPGADRFAGESYHTARWPQDAVDLAGKRVGVIGLGASGVQLVPVVADVAAELVVFQRTPNYVVASSNREVGERWMRQVREDYPENFRRAREHVFAVPFENPAHGAKEVSPQERERIFERGWNDGGFHFMLETFNDLAVDPESNEHASEFIRSKIRETVQDPRVAELLSPRDYPFNGKRPPGGHGYYEAYNRSNVRLVDVRTQPIDEIVPAGVRVGGELHELDVLVFATGFDAMTGALNRIDVVGRDGVVLREKWSEGLRTNLGLAVHGFPNFFMVLGPQTPYANLPVAIEAGVQWVAGAIGHVERSGARRIESTARAEQDWADEVNEAGAATMMAHGVDANAWFIETSEPGRPVEFNVFMGGADSYFRRCDEVAEHGYPGFVVSEP